MDLADPSKNLGRFEGMRRAKGARRPTTVNRLKRTNSGCERVAPS